MDLTYATEFDVYYYKDGYKLIDVHEDKQYLIVPEGEEEPENLADDIVVIQKPTENIYMAATASMSLFDAIGGIDKVKFSGLEASGWYVENTVNLDPLLLSKFCLFLGRTINEYRNSKHCKLFCQLFELFRLLFYCQSLFCIFTVFIYYFVSIRDC